MNYKNCTVEELATFFREKTSQSITQQINYYTKQGNFEVVSKIKRARILCKQQKLTEKMEAMCRP